MKYAVKLQGKQIEAYELGAGTPMEAQLIRKGTIVKRGTGYLLFSREAVNGQGQKAKPGDFFKLDGGGYPYPNERGWFLANHRHLEGNRYEQIPQPLAVWQVQDGEHDLIRWLTEQGRLCIREQEPERYFNAHLWGADLSAAKDAVVVFYGVKFGPGGEIADVDFNFVAWEEFRRTYAFCDENGSRN